MSNDAVANCVSVKSRVSRPNRILLANLALSSDSGTHSLIIFHLSASNGMSLDISA